MLIANLELRHNLGDILLGIILADILCKENLISKLQEIKKKYLHV